MRPSQRPLYTANEIANRVARIAKQIDKDYGADHPVVLPILKGGFIFAADLVRRLTVPVAIDFVRARSYSGALSRGTVELLVLPTTPLAGRRVLLIEDILDTGRTTASIVDRLRLEGPSDIRICALLDKPMRRAAQVEPDYVGFQIADQFVVGYGLDYDEQYRELPAIYTLDD